MSEIPWETLKQKRTDGKVNHSRKAKIAQKEPRKTIAKQLAEQKPRTKIPGSEIRVENIIPGSPLFIPYHQVKPRVTGKGKGIKNIKIKQESKQDIHSCSTNMARIKCTLTKEEHEKEDGKNCHDREWAKRATTRAKRSAEAAKTAKNPTSIPKLHRTNPAGGKAPQKQLATKAMQKAAPQKLTKPTHYAIIAMWEIHHFQKSVDLLIPIESNFETPTMLSQGLITRCHYCFKIHHYYILNTL